MKLLKENIEVRPHISVWTTWKGCVYWVSDLEKVGSCMVLAYSTSITKRLALEHCRLQALRISLIVATEVWPHLLCHNVKESKLFCKTVWQTLKALFDTSLSVNPMVVQSWICWTWVLCWKILGKSKI